VWRALCQGVAVTDPKWQNSAAVPGGDPVGQVGTLKEQLGATTSWLRGITLYHALIAAGLIDEYRLFVYPVCRAVAARCSLTGSLCQP
jgi:hypothetical protein